MCTEHQCPQVHKTNISELKETDRTRYNDSGRPQHPTAFNRQNIQIENQQRYSRIKQYLGQMDLTDVYRIFHPLTEDYTFFSAAPGTFSKIDHILLHKAKLNKYKNY
jgi:exonuclease III